MLFRPIDPTDQEVQVIQDIDRLHGDLSYALGQPKRWTGLLRRNTAARNVQGSNSIEGYQVTIEDAVAAIDGEEPLDPKSENWLVTKGYRDALTYVLQKPEDPTFRYSAELLKALHFMMVGYDLSKNPGRWRPGPIFVRDDATGDQVYEGPPADKVPALIEELVVSLNQSSPHALIRAALAHLNLVMIHPFSDGNGRMGRCLQTLVLARSGVLAAPFSSIEEYLGRNTRAYYDVLAQVGGGAWHPERDPRPWIRFCLTAHYRQAMTLLRRSREIHKLFDELEVLVQKLGLKERMMMALGDAALGQRVTNGTYRAAADISDAVAGNDLRALVRAGLLVPKGERRGRYYLAAPTLFTIRQRVAEPKSIPDPLAQADASQGTLFPSADEMRPGKPSATWPPRPSD